MGLFDDYRRNALLAALANTQPRRTTFLSYYSGDESFVRSFVQNFGGTNGTIIPRVIGLTPDTQINSQNTEYVINKIREDSVTESTVTIVLVGTCTHSRRYIDWETKRSLLNGNGLLGILLPHLTSAHLPERFRLNWNASGTGYARFRNYPETSQELASWVEDAYKARTDRAHLINNPQEVWMRNRVCQVCGITH